MERVERKVNIGWYGWINLISAYPAENRSQRKMRLTRPDKNNILKYLLIFLEEGTLIFTPKIDLVFKICQLFEVSAQ